MALKNLDSFCSRLIESILFSIFGQVCVCRVFFSAFILKEEQAVLEFADSLSLLPLFNFRAKTTPFTMQHQHNDSFIMPFLTVYCDA